MERLYTFHFKHKDTFLGKTVVQANCINIARFYAKAYKRKEIRNEYRHIPSNQIKTIHLHNLKTNVL